jgi:transposase
MNVLPIKKQFEIMDLIYQGLPIRVIARRANVSISTVMDYKKRGPPVYRKYKKNSPGNPYPTTVQEEIKVARQQFQEIQLLNNKLIIERNTANRNINDLEKDNAWKTTEIGRLNYKNKLKETQLNHAYERNDEGISLAKDLIKNNNKLKNEKGQQEDKIKNIEEKFQQCKIDLVKAKELQGFSERTIHDLTNERDAYRDKAERIEKKHESDWILNLLVAVLGFTGGIVVDHTVIPKIRNFILSWGVEHGINTADYADLTSPVKVLRPDIHYKYSGAIPITIASSTFWSGTFFNPYGETYGYEPVPNYKDAIAQPTIYHIENGVTSETNASEVLYSGAYPPTQANNTGAEDTVFSNTLDGLIQSDIHGTSSEIMISTYTSGIIQTSGAVIINHIQTPPVFIYPLVTPVPNELITPYGIAGYR